MAKITLDAITTPAASRRSRRCAGSVDRNMALGSTRWGGISLLRDRKRAALEQGNHLSSRHRPGEVVTLRFTAAVQSEELGVLRGFDAFGGHIEHQLLRNDDERAH